MKTIQIQCLFLVGKPGIAAVSLFITDCSPYSPTFLDRIYISQIDQHIIHFHPPLQKKKEKHHTILSKHQKISITNCVFQWCLCMFCCWILAIEVLFQPYNPWIWPETTWSSSWVRIAGIATWFGPIGWRWGPSGRSSSVERRSSGVPQPTPRLPRARSEPRRNAPKLGGCGCGLLMVLCCGAGLKTPFSHENGGLEDDISLQGGHFPLPWLWEEG